MENEPDSGMTKAKKIDIKEPDHHPYRLLVIVVLVGLVFGGFFYASRGKKTPVAPTPEQTKAMIEAEFKENPFNFVMFNGELKRRSEMTDADWKAFDQQMYESAKKDYSPDMVVASGEFFGLNSRFYEAEQVVRFRDISRYPDLPLTKVDFRDGHWIDIRCKAEDFALIMQRTRR